MARRAAKVDGNQAAIVAALEAAGCAVQSLAGVGNGVPDLLVYAPFQWSISTPAKGGVETRLGCYFLIECKDGSGFTPAQKKFHATWPGPSYVANSVAEALMIVGAANADQT